VAWVFVRLKLRLLRNRLGTSSVLGLVGFVLVWMTTFGLGVGGAALLGAAGRFSGDVRAFAPHVFFSVFALGWVLGPLVTASIEDSLDPRKFESLPIGRMQLGVGLATAGAMGPGGVGTAIALVGGAVIGYGGLASAVPVALTAVLALALSVMTARWLITLLSDLLRSRRTREVAALVVGVSFALPGLASVLFLNEGVEIVGSVANLAGALSWLPPGALGGSVVAFSKGEWGSGLIGVGYGAVALAVVTWLYGRAIDRMQVTVGSASSSRVVRGGSLWPSFVPLPSGAVGAVAAKELIYLRRDSRVRGQLLGSLIAILIIGGTALPVLRTEFGPFLSVPMAFFVVVALVINQFGYDGGSFWGYITIVPRMLDVLKGKNLAALIFGVPVSVVAGLVGALLAGTAAYLPAAIIAAVAVIVVWSGVGNLTSVFGPIKMPESNPFGSGGMSGASFVASMVGLLGAAALMLPLIGGIGAAAYFGGPGWAAGAAAVGVGYSVGLYLLIMRFGEPIVEARVFSVMDVIDAD
jgi:ABC-2 type transport system permease protein